VTAELTAPVRHSPLEAWVDAFAALPRTIRLAEVPFCSMLNLRPSTPSSAIAATLGGPLPTAPCTAMRHGARDVLWLGPDEWLVVCPPGEEDGLEPALRSAGAAVTDVSAQRTVLSLSGPSSAEVLAHGCAIDLHPQMAPAGTCVQTLLARTGITIVVQDDRASAFTLLVRASFAGYLASWLIDACADLP
jgi:sarcosine oxidase, subunit gamma